MTIRPTARPIAAGAGQFPELRPREDMQNTLHLNYPGHLPALSRRLGYSATTAVTSETPMGWNTRQRRGLLQPDLLVAFDVDWSVIVAEQGYSIDGHGKPPDFVLEIASATTSGRDEREKRNGYANFGVPEYWRFDDTGGQYYERGLAGDRLVDGEYQPIAVVEVGHARYRGYSAALGLHVCWEYGYLRWYDPATGYLPTYYEEAAARIAAEAERDAAEVERNVAEAERDAAEAERNAAEAERDAERAARLQLEAEVRRLRDRLPPTGSA